MLAWKWNLLCKQTENKSENTIKALWLQKLNYVNFMGARRPPCTVRRIWGSGRLLRASAVCCLYTVGPTKYILTVQNCALFSLRQGHPYCEWPHAQRLIMFFKIKHWRNREEVKGGEWFKKIANLSFLINREEQKKQSSYCKLFSCRWHSHWQ